MGDVIYDFGMNNGDDVAYYLTKGRRVVAVEANNALCDMAAKRFYLEIQNGQLIILNIALSEAASDDPMPFYIHKQEHVLSQILAPSIEDADKFHETLVPRRTASSIISQFGDPHYVKIDIEHYDHIVLREMFSQNIIPEYISAESHSIEVFCALVMAGYKSFNLVDGASVPEVYGFPIHSAGPYGRDLITPWYDRESFFYRLASEGMGWKDIHASTTQMPDMKTDWRLKDRLWQSLQAAIRSARRKSKAAFRLGRA